MSIQYKAGEEIKNFNQDEGIDLELLQAELKITPILT